MGAEIAKENTRKEWRIIISVMIGTFLALVNSSIINIALPTFVKVFDTNLVTVQWLVVGHMLTTGLVTPLVGFLGDRFSCRKVYLTGMSLLALTALGCSLANHVGVLIFFRVVQGIAGGLLMPVTTTIVYQFISRERQLMAMAVISMMNSFGFAIGPSFGGALLTYWGWRSIFWFNIPVAILAIVMVMRNVPKRYLDRNGHVDFVGVLLVMAGTVSLLFSFSNGNAWGWTSMAFLGGIAVGGAMLGGFVWHELRMKAPMLNFEAFRYRHFTYGLVMNCSMNIALCLSPFLMAIYLQDVLLLDALHAGLVLLIPTMIMGFASPVAGKFNEYVSSRILLVGSMVILLVSTFNLSRFTVVTTVGYILLWLSLRYLALGFTAPIINNYAMSAVPQSLAGHGSALIGWTRQLITTLSLSVFTSILNLREMIYLNGQFAQELGAAEQMRQIQCTAINDITFYSWIILLVCLPMAFLFKDEGMKKKFIHH